MNVWQCNLFFWLFIELVSLPCPGKIISWNFLTLAWHCGELPIKFILMKNACFVNLFNFPISRICNAEILIQCYLLITMKRSGAVGQVDQKKVPYRIRHLILVLNILYLFCTFFFHQVEHWLFGTEYLVGKCYDLDNYTVYDTCQNVLGKTLNLLLWKNCIF